MILLTADWHIKLGQKNVPVDWALARYREFFKQVNDIECNLHIISGDIFDRLPTMQELEVYFSFVSSATVETIITDGNHEATNKGQTFLTYLKEATSRINPLVTIIDKSIEYKKKFSILSYVDLHKKNVCDQFNKDLPLFTHVRGEIPPHVKPEVDLEIFKDFPVVFAGDLHSHSNSQGNIVYPGSPMTISFHRAKVKTGYILIEDDWSWTWHEFKLPQLLRKTVENPVDMVATEYDHTIYELQGDLQDLAAVENSELLDKKVVKRSTEAALVLSSEMTIVEELAEYLEFILMLDSSKVENIIGTFHNYIKGNV